MRIFSAIVSVALLTGCVHCAAGANGPDASVAVPDSFEAKARDAVPHPRLKELKIAPKWVQAVPVAPNYFVAPIEPFLAFHLDFGLDPAVVVRGGAKECAGRLVESDIAAELVLIRCDTPSKPIDLKQAPEALALLKRYFETWGKYVKDKPRL